MKLAYLACILPFIFFQAKSQSEQIQFKKLSIEEGLSQSTVRTILNDSKGYMWFGTRDGLNRYDGNKITIYRHDPKDSATISSSEVTNIFEDRAGNLWISTMHGIDRFDREKEIFIHYKASKDFIRASQMAQAGNGDLWLASYDGLHKYDAERQRFVFYDIQPDTVQFEIAKLMIDDQGFLWLGSIWFLAKLDPSSKTLRYYSADPKNPKRVISGTRPFAFQDSDGHIWVGSWGGGLSLYDPGKDSFTKYIHDPADPNSLCHNEVLSMAQAENGLLWIGTQNGGISIFDYKKKQFTTLRQSIKNPATLTNNSIHSLYRDQSDNMWVGTWAGGLNLYSRYGNKFVSHKGILDFDNPNVYDVYGDVEGNIWIGVEDGGLVRFDQSTEQYTFYPNEHAGEFLTNVIFSISELNKDTLVLTYHEGSFAFFDKRRKTFTHYFPANHNSSDSYSMPSVRAGLIGATKTCALKDRDGNLWLADWGNGVNFYNKKTKTFITYSENLHDSTSLNGLDAFALYEDREGNLWVGTGKGLSRFDRENNRFVRYQDNRGSDYGLKNSVFSIFEDSRGILWIGTSGAGLLALDRTTSRVVRHPELDALPNKVINGILEDDNGNLWLSTNHGISRYNPVEKTVRNYDATDGLQGNEFNRNACYKAPDGRLFFAGTQGWNSFHPDRIFDNPHLPPVVITDLQLFSRSVVPGEKGSVLTTAINETKELTLSYKHSVFSFEFAALDFCGPSKNQYAYKMEGFDQDWVHAGNRHLATYTNLDPASYIFRVKASNNDGKWNETGTSITIHITPPWWLTWWSKTFGALAIAGLGAGFYWLRVRAIKARNIKLEKLVDVRTKELQAVNEELVSMEKMKENMMAVMSHEIRTPLNSMIGLSHVLKRRSPRPDQIEIIDTLKTSGDHLLHLVNDVLDYNKIQAGKLQLESLRFDLIEILRQLHSMHKRLAEEKNIHFSVQISTALPSLLVGDPTRLTQILSNIISNAIKFTPQGSVTIFVRTVRATEETCMIEFRVEDTGIGIPADKLHLLYQPFSQLRPETHRQYGGSGLGLLIVKNLVEAMKGTVAFESIPDKSTAVTVSIPFSIEHDIERHDARIDQPKLANLKGLHVLYTEDVKSNQLLVKTLLDDYEIDCHIANDGRETIAKTTAEKFDVILLDVQLPDIDGFDLTAQIRSDKQSKNAGTPIILFSAHTGINDAKIKSCGANDIIGKPFKPDDLLLKIERNAKAGASGTLRNNS